MMDLGSFQTVNTVLKKAELDLNKLGTSSKTPPSQGKINTVLRQLENGLSQLQSFGKKPEPFSAKQLQYVNRMMSKMEESLSGVSHEKFSSGIKQIEDGLRQLKMLEKTGLVTPFHAQRANMTMKQMEGSLSMMRDLLARTAHEFEIRKKYQELRKWVDRFRRGRVQRKEAPAKGGEDESRRQR